MREEDVAPAIEEHVPTRFRRCDPGRLALGLILSPYIFFCLLIAVGNPFIETQAVRIVLSVLLYSAGLLNFAGALLSFRVAVRSDPHVPWGRNRDRRLGCLGLCLFAGSVVMPISGLLLGAPLGLLLEPARYTPRFDATSSNLYSTYGSLSNFAKAQPDKCLPALTSHPKTPNRESKSAFISFLQSIFFGKDGPDDRRLFSNLQTSEDQFAVVDDWDYFYLGYEIHSEEQLLAFASGYRRVLESGGDFRDDLPVTNAESGNPDQVLARLNLRPVPLPPGATRPPLPAHRGADVPVFIERIDHNKSRGGYVLYLDGHVEFLDYPGRWPMTEATFALLNELDQLGPRGAPPAKE